ncbi:hypothetical protein KJ641_01960 [Patescibacteria group bacterium]|nr:hypothetical protein [Patescibacteria group bacterium]MBU1895613.1 hypothetical protein [Patescibacteria group bacterium]
MTPRRLETSLTRNQPVRFYKIVAVTFLLITISLLGAIIFMSSKRAVITISSKETPTEVNFIIGVGETDESMKLEGLVATTTISISEVFSPTGTEQEPAQATGIITIHNISSTDQPLVATTRFLTPDDVLFRLENAVTVPALGSVQANVYADEDGANGNIGPTERLNIPGLGESRQREVYGSSDDYMTGGLRTIGILSEEDINRAKAVLREKIIEVGKGRFTDLGDNYSAVYSVVSETSSSDEEVGTEVSGFTVTLSAEVVGIFYQAEEVSALAGKEIMKQVVDDTEIIQMGSGEPVITFGSYNSANSSATLSVFQDGLASLNPESRQIEKMMFFGKSRDEIRRYVLSLDHVHSVDIKFTPAWMQTAPHVSDHVSVVVKNIR